MKVVNTMKIIQVLLIGVTFLLINNICLADDTNNSIVKYYRWAMIERQDRKPMFSATTTLKHIYNPNTKHEKNYYKAIYKDNILQEVLTYRKDKLIRIDYFDKDGVWLNYVKYSKSKKISCSIILDTLEKKESVLTISCNDDSKKIITYLYKELNNEQKRILGEDIHQISSYWTIYQIVKYKRGKRIFKQIVKDSTCFSYDKNNTIISQEYCSDYEHTKPMDHANWSLVPMW